MKKFLVAMSPLCVVLFVFMWVSCGLKSALIFFGVELFTLFGLAKWIEFVDKYIKD